MKKIIIGKIVNTFGLKGELKLLSQTSDLSLLKPLDNFYIDGYDTLFKCERISDTGNFIKLKIFGYDDINMVEPLKNRDAFILIENVKLKENQFLTVDLIGSDVFDGDNKIAKVIDVQNYGASDILVLNMAGKERLVPFVDEYIGEVNTQNKSIKITKNFYEGLVWKLIF